MRLQKQYNSLSEDYDNVRQHYDELRKTAEDKSAASKHSIDPNSESTSCLRLGYSAVGPLLLKFVASFFQVPTTNNLVEAPDIPDHFPIQGAHSIQAATGSFPPPLRPSPALLCGRDVGRQAAVELVRVHAPIGGRRAPEPCAQFLLRPTICPQRAHQGRLFPRPKGLR